MDDLFDINEHFGVDDLNTTGSLDFTPQYDEETDGSIFSSHSSSPFESGFDAEHPYPTYEGLRNAGFSDYLANQIAYGTHHCYSDRELFECMYNSDDPVAAYNEMVEAKAQASIEKTDRLIRDIENQFGL